MSDERQVVVTGIGVVSPLGNDVNVFFNNLRKGRSGVRSLADIINNTGAAAGEDRDILSWFTLEKVERRSARIVALPPRLSSLDYAPRRDVRGVFERRLARNALYALAASFQAVADSRLPFGPTEETARYGVEIGTGIGGIDVLEEQHTKFIEGKNPSPFTIPAIMPNSAQTTVSAQLGYGARSDTTTTACAASIHAMQHAYDAIRNGKADVIITGGTEYAATPFSISGFESIRALATSYNNRPEEASRPFTIDAEGFVMGAGAGILVFEELKHALNRGAKIHAKVLSVSNVTDGYGTSHPAQPHPEAEGLIRCINEVLEQANLTPKDISVIDVHGTSTGANEVCEYLAITQVFENLAGKPPIQAPKSCLAHDLGASGGIEAIADMKLIEHQVVLPIRNLTHDNLDPRFHGLNYVIGKERPHEVRRILKLTNGFGAQLGAIIFEKYEAGA